MTSSSARHATCFHPSSVGSCSSERKAFSEWRGCERRAKRTFSSHGKFYDFCRCKLIKRFSYCRIPLNIQDLRHVLKEDAVRNLFALFYRLVSRFLRSLRRSKTSPIKKGSGRVHNNKFLEALTGRQSHKCGGLAPHPVTQIEARPLRQQQQLEGRNHVPALPFFYFVECKSNQKCWIRCPSPPFALRWTTTYSFAFNFLLTSDRLRYKSTQARECSLYYVCNKRRSQSIPSKHSHSPPSPAGANCKIQLDQLLRVR